MRIGPLSSLAFGLLFSFSALGQAEDDHSVLHRMLDRFLAGATVNDPAVHADFWADDLVYTSSAGTRFGKAELMAGLSESSDNAEAGPVYAAADVAIRIVGEVAVITFRLTADENGARVAEYFNTGVLRKDDEGWKAFTWQATRIPDRGAQ